MESIISFVIIIIDFLMLYKAYKIFFNIRFRRSVTFVVILILVLLYIFTNFSGNLFYRILDLVIPLLLFRKNFILRPLIFVAFALLEGTMSYVMFSLLCFLLGASKGQLEFNGYVSGFSIIMAQLVLYFIISLISIRRKELAILSLRSNPYIKETVVSIVLIFVTLFFVIFYYNDYSNGYNQINVIMGNILSSIVLILLCILELYEKAIDNLDLLLREKVKGKQFEMQEQLNQLTLDNMERLSSLRHDFKNHLLVLKGRMEKEEYQEALNYINKIQTLTEAASGVVVSNHTAVSALITTKKEECKNKNIAINYELNFLTISLTDLDLSIILGNLLDNALEAAEKCKDNRWIDISITEKKEYLIIECINTFAKKPLLQGKQFLTQKRNHEEHGIGLKNVKESVKKYDGTMDIEYSKGIFSVKILLKNMQTERI